MSAHHAPAADPDRPDEIDPYGIVPEGFCDAWDADTIAAALEKAEAAPSTTAPDEQPRCPSCVSVCLVPKSSGGGEQKIETPWKCHECGRHVPHALPPIVEARRQAAHAPATERDAARPRCRGCLSTALYPVPERAQALADRWVCLDCAARFDDALPSVRATARGDATAAEKAAIREARSRDLTLEDRDLTERLSQQHESYGPSEQATFEEVTRG